MGVAVSIMYPFNFETLIHNKHARVRINHFLIHTIK